MQSQLHVSLLLLFSAVVVGGLRKIVSYGRQLNLANYFADSIIALLCAMGSQAARQARRHL